MSWAYFDCTFSLFDFTMYNTIRLLIGLNRKTSSSEVSPVIHIMFQNTAMSFQPVISDKTFHVIKFKFKFKSISATFSKNTINKRKYNDNIRISDNMIVHKKNHSKSCSINQLNSKWSKIIAFSLVTSVVAEAVIINTRNNVWCDGSLPLKTRLSKKKYWFLGLTHKKEKNSASAKNRNPFQRIQQWILS